LLVFFLGASSSSTLDFPLAFLFCLTLGPAVFLVGGFYCRVSLDSIELGILQNYLPKLLIALLERVAGLALQQKQLLVKHEADLNPWSFPLILSLLLTSEATKGGLDSFLTTFFSGAA
jgi:hypothetical protein